MCPAIIFAKSLTDKLTGLLKYEIISIIVINGKSTAGTPLGINIVKYFNPCFKKPIIVTAIKINNYEKTLWFHYSFISYTE